MFEVPNNYGRTPHSGRLVPKNLTRIGQDDDELNRPLLLQAEITYIIISAERRPETEPFARHAKQIALALSASIAFLRP